MKSVTELIRKRAETTADRLAFTFLKNGESEAARLSYAELDLNSRKIAGALQQISAPGDRVLLMYPPGLDFISGFLGCLYAGVIAVPAFMPNPVRLDRQMSRLLSIAHSAGTQIVLTTSEQSTLLESQFSRFEALSSTTILSADGLDNAMAHACKVAPATTQTIALLQYTSGSTAEPRGVVVSHGNILHNLAFIQEREANNPHSVSVSWLPSFHDMGLLEGILSPIYGGYPQFLMSPLAFIQRPLRWLRAISRYRASISGGPNFAYEYCIQSVSDDQLEELDLRSWQVAYNGSETVHAATMENFARKFERCGFRYEAFCPVYGLAESTALTTATRCGAGPCLMPGSGERELAVACGRRDSDSQIIIVDPDTCTEREAGREGEIWLAGPSVAQGYWNDAELSRQVFDAFLADTGDGPYLRTGDLGYLVDERLYVTGRIKDLIILRGRKLFSQDIEFTVARASDAVRKQGVAAFSIKADKNEQLVLQVELDTRRLKRSLANGNDLAETPTVDYESIATAIIESVSREHEASVSTLLLLEPGQVAKTSSGKIRRYLCRQRFLSGEIDPLYRWDLAPAAQTA